VRIEIKHFEVVVKSELGEGDRKEASPGGNVNDNYKYIKKERIGLYFHFGGM
jgi:hypothetical protein